MIFPGMLSQRLDTGLIFCPNFFLVSVSPFIGCKIGVRQKRVNVSEDVYTKSHLIVDFVYASSGLVSIQFDLKRLNSKLVQTPQYMKLREMLNLLLSMYIDIDPCVPLLPWKHFLSISSGLSRLTGEKRYPSVDTNQSFQPHSIKRRSYQLHKHDEADNF